MIPLALTLAWLGAGLLLLGHRDPDLSPVRDGVSTYAARGQRGGWVKGGLFLWAVSLGLSGYAVFASLEGWRAFLMAASTALAVVGLLLIILFDETVPEFRRLFASLPQAVYEQTYHNAGVQLNGVGTLGMTLIWADARGLLLPLLGLIVTSQILRHTPWPVLLAIPYDESRGLRQRVEIGLLFLAFQVLLLQEPGIQ